MADKTNELELKLSKNPHVVRTDRYCVDISMDSAKGFYSFFMGGHSEARFRSELEKAGLPADEETCILGETLIRWFEQHGCPEQDVRVLYRQVSVDPADGAVLDTEGLIATGIFRPKLKGIGLTDEWRKKVLVYYPEMPALEALAMAGIDPAILGKERLAKVERNLGISCARIRAAQEKAHHLEEQEAPGKKEETAQGALPEDPQPDERPLTAEELLKTGLFVKMTSGIGPSKDLERKLLAAYPGQTIEEGLEKAGLSVAAVGRDRVNRLKKRILREKGMPSSERAGLPQRTGGEKLTGRLSDDELLRTGKFVRSHAGIVLIPEIERQLYVNYPDQPIEEGLKKAGIVPEDMGRARIYRLKARFDALEGRDPQLYKDRKCTEYSEATVSFYSSHPYVASCSGRSASLNSRFFEEAHFLAGQPVMRLLRIFCIDPGLFSYEEREDIKKTVEGYVEAEIREPSFEEVMDCPPILRQAYYNRMEVLEEEIGCCLGEISEAFPKMGMDQKKRLLLAIRGFSRDPDGRYTTEYILDRIGVARSTYYGIVSNERYGQASAEKDAQDDADVSLIIQVMEYRGFKKGAWQIYMMMPDIVHVQFGLNKIRRLMRKYGVHSGVRGPNQEKRQMREYLKGQVRENTLDRKFRLYRPGQVLLTDVTYLIYGPDRKKAYCSAMIDPVTSKLVALNISEKNDLDLAKETLRLCAEEPRVAGCILHSDRGCLYLSSEFQKEAKRIGLVQSMSKLGCCWDNAPAESFNGNLKQEVCYESCTAFEELRALIEDYEEYYNNERHVRSRNQMTPVQYEAYLLSLSDTEWAEYIAARNAEYSKMKERSREKAAKYARSHGTDTDGKEGNGDAG